MGFKDAIRKLGREDVTATFGIGPPTEIVGPLKPQSVYYGQAFGYDVETEGFVLDHPSPLLLFSFNKYRSDLPPWENVREVVLASEYDGDVVEVTFKRNIGLRGIATTGNLKTVELTAVHITDGVAGDIITRDAVAEKRGIGKDTTTFRVNEVLD